MTSNVSLTHHISCFLREELGEAQGISRHTYKSYCIALQFLSEFLAIKHKKNLFDILTDELSYECIYEWILKYQTRKSWDRSTWNSRLSAVKSFVKFLARTDNRYLDLSRRVGLISSKKVLKKIQDYMTVEEFEAVMSKIPERNKSDFRNKLIFQLLFFTGARVAELTGIRFQDIVSVRRARLNLYLFGKGRKERNVPILEKATVKNLKTYIEMLSRHETSSEYIFSGYNGARMTEENIRKICRVHFNPLIENKNITPHSFRHSAAMNWLENGVEIFQLSILLGHENLETTTRYLKTTFKIKEDALIRGSQDKKISKVFKTKYSTNADFWESLKIAV